MRHCCSFDAFDIWYLIDTPEFLNRTLFIGVCPICNKHVSVLYQKNIKTNSLAVIKKVGESSMDFSEKLISDILYSRNSINKMKFKPKPFGWKYGVNKQKINKDGSVVVEQYSVDFDGNSELIKKIHKNT